MNRSIIRVPPPGDPIARLVEQQQQNAREESPTPSSPTPLQAMPLSTSVAPPTGLAVFGSDGRRESVRRLTVSELVDSFRNPALTDGTRAAFDAYKQIQLDETSRDAPNSFNTAEVEARNDRIARAQGQTRSWKSFLSANDTSSRTGDGPILGEEDTGMDIESGLEDGIETLAISHSTTNANEPVASASAMTTTTTTSVTNLVAPPSSLVLRRSHSSGQRRSSRIHSRSKTPEVSPGPVSTASFRTNKRKSTSRSNSSSSSSRRRIRGNGTDIAHPLADRDAVVRAIASTLPTNRQRQVLSNDVTNDLESSVYNRAANQAANVLHQKSVCFACNTHKYLIGKEMLYKVWREYEDQIAVEFLTAPDSVINQVVDFYDNIRQLAAINQIDLPYMDHAKWYDHFLIHNLTPETIRHHMILKMLGLADVLSKNAVLAAQRGQDIKDKLDVERTKALNAISNQLRHWLQLDVTNINIRTRMFLERASNPANNITTGGDNSISASPLSLPLTFRVHHSLAEHSKKKATIRRAKY